MTHSRAPRPVLVTGGAGYIGSHTCAALARRGFRPIVYDNLSTGNAWAVRWGELVRGDVRDVARLIDVMAALRPVAVLHFAALSQIGEAHERLVEYFDVNVGGTLAVLHAMRQTGVRSLVFSSTAAVYGESDGTPLNEDAPMAALNPYGETKLLAEQVIGGIDRWSDVGHVSLRYFNAAGAAADALVGEAHEPETHLIPRLLRSVVVAEEAQVHVFGTDYDTPDGTCIRDYIHVDDLAEAHIAAVDHLLGGGPSMAVNLGIGRGFSVREVAAAVEQVTRRRVILVESPRRIGDPSILVADPAKAASALGFKARYTTLEEIVESAWRWHSGRHLELAGGDLDMPPPIRLTVTS